jgi:S1-C subfamily serine protease
LIRDGRIERGYLGIGARTVPIPRAVAYARRLAIVSGVQVESIAVDGPGARSELRVGDVIIAFDGRPVAAVDDLHRLLAEGTAGRRTGLVVLRAGVSVDVDVTPSSSPAVS